MKRLYACFSWLFWMLLIWLLFIALTTTVRVLADINLPTEAFSNAIALPSLFFSTLAATFVVISQERIGRLKIILIVGVAGMGLAFAIIPRPENNLLILRTDAQPNKGTAPKAENADEDKIKNIVTAFSHSGLLGQDRFYFSRINNVSEDFATAFIGVSSGEEEDDNAVRVDLKKINGKWKIVSTGMGSVSSNGLIKANIERLDQNHGSVFPSIQRDEMLINNGGNPYYGQYPSELDVNEEPIISLMQEIQNLDALSMSVLNKYKTPGILIRTVEQQRNQKQPLVILGLNEIEVAQYLQNLSTLWPHFDVKSERVVDVCGVSLIRVDVTIGKIPSDVPQIQYPMKLAFDINGKHSSCDIHASQFASQKEVSIVAEVKENLAESIENGASIKQVSELIGQGADLNEGARGGNRDTPLIIAARKGQIELVKLLIEKGANIDASNFTPGDNALKAAIINENAELVRLLLNREAKVNARETGAWSALRYAASVGNVEIIKAILDKGADVNESTLGQPVLITATLSNNFDAVKILCEHDAKIDARDGAEETALMKAAASGYFNISQYLVQHGADVNAKDKSGNSVLIKVLVRAPANSLQLIQYLLEKGADLIATNNIGETALMAAAGSGDVTATKFIVGRGVDINAVNKQGENALYKALSANAKPQIAFQVFQLLLDNGANLSVKNRNEKTVLMAAAENGVLDAVKMLLSKGTDIHAKTSDGYSVLMAAAYGGNQDIVNLMLNAGLDVNAKTKSGVSVLMEAARGYGDVDLFRLLLAKDADQDAKDSAGRTALDYARQNNEIDHPDLEVVKLLQIQNVKTLRHLGNQVSSKK